MNASKRITTNTQQFKRGDIVRTKCGHLVDFKTPGGEWYTMDVSPEDANRLAVVEYSYLERYGYGGANIYSIIWMDTGGSIAWYRDSELDFVRHGGELEIINARAKFASHHLPRSPQ